MTKSSDLAELRERYAIDALRGVIGNCSEALARGELRRRYGHHFDADTLEAFMQEAVARNEWAEQWIRDGFGGAKEGAR